MPKLHGIKVDEKLEQSKLRAGQHKRSNQTGFKGYPGLQNTARQISEYIPQCKYYVEPFAGLGRVAKHVTAEHIVLNDLSDYAISYIKKHFRNATVTQKDFEICMNETDSVHTKFLLDPPWHEEIYDINPLTVCTMKPKEYYQRLKQLLSTMSADWFVASEADGNAKILDGYSIEVKSKKKSLFGLHARTLIVSNKPLKQQIQTLREFF